MSRLKKCSIASAVRKSPSWCSEMLPLQLSTQFPLSLAFLAHLGWFLVQEVETLRPPFVSGCGSYPTTKVRGGQVWSVDHRPGQEKQSGLPSLPPCPLICSWVDACLTREKVSFIPLSKKGLLLIQPNLPLLRKPSEVGSAIN